LTIPGTRSEQPSNFGTDNEEVSSDMDTEDKVSHIFERYSSFLLALDTNDSLLKSLESD
jgi:hypothetical protein